MTLPAAVLVQHAQESLLLALLVSLPIVGVAALIGFIVAGFQAASQIQDPTLSHLPRWLGVVAMLAVIGPWIGHQIAAFGERIFSLAGH